MQVRPPSEEEEGLADPTRGPVKRTQASLTVPAQATRSFDRMM